MREVQEFALALREVEALTKARGKDHDRLTDKIQSRSKDMVCEPGAHAYDDKENIAVGGTQRPFPIH